MKRGLRSYEAGRGCCHLLWWGNRTWAILRTECCTIWGISIATGRTEERCPEQETAYAIWTVKTPRNQGKERDKNGIRNINFNLRYIFLLKVTHGKQCNFYLNRFMELFCWRCYIDLMTLVSGTQWSATRVPRLTHNTGHKLEGWKVGLSWAVRFCFNFLLVPTRHKDHAT